jgi:endonuclease/exonuclease/phosphatase family metal-dependent hydrolase
VTELRVLTYNIHGLRDDVDAVCDVIRQCNADVVCIQEAPRFMRWRSKRAAIARKAGLVVATADRPAGLMLMTSLRMSVRRTHFSLLSKRPQLHQRAVCGAVLSAGGADWHVVSMHLSLSADERAEHLPEIWQAVAAPEPAPLVLAGDVNEEPAGPVWRGLADRLTDAWTVHSTGSGDTYSATRPHKRIDGIFVDPAVEVVSCSVVDVAGVTAASDHLPVLAVLRQRS